MYDTSARVALVKARVRQLRRRREKHEICALSALCLALAASLVGAISALTGAAPAIEPGLYGTMLLYQDAGGYVLVAVVSVVATVLCMRFRDKTRQDGRKEEESDE